MSLTLGAFVITIGVQVGAAVFNSRRSNRLSRKLAAKQREFEEKSLCEGIENTRTEFAELCNLQRQLDAAVQTDRLQLIRNDTEQNLELIALIAALDRWPLFVAPYVITNGSLYNEGELTDGFMFPMNCILTTSTDRDFNRKIFPSLEENLADFCLKYWNESAEKSIRFYKGAWRDTIEDAGYRIEDIQTHLSSVPTMVISPKVKDRKLFFRFHWWGLSSNPNDTHFNDEFDPEISVAYDSFEQISEVISQASAKLSALISYFADLYYWNYYRSSPILPALIHDTHLILSESDLRDYSSAYIRGIESIKSMIVESDDYVRYADAITSIIPRDKYQAFVTSLLNKLANCFGINDRDVTIFDLINSDGGYWHLDEQQKECLKRIVLSEKTIKMNKENNTLEINQTITSMDASSYSEYKNQLVQFAESALKISDIPESDRIDIEKTKNKVETDQFCVTLIGEYQGGKSTTFDILCGGRDISPRGNNMKTSACRIRATNIPDNIAEYAEVKWKSDYQLLQTMKDVLLYIEPEDLGYEISETKPFSYEGYVQLGNPQHIELIQGAINEAKNNNPNEAMKDILVVAQFIVEFYSRTINLRKKINGYTLSEVLPFMVFPKNMHERIINGNNSLSDFTETEALFAFVETVDCYIHSKELRKLGCSVIDCPGLFASDYDTSIAVLTIADSDAVLYLLSGEKMMSQGDTKAISEIYKSKKIVNPQYDGKDVFFAINQRKSLEETSFIGYDLSKINGIGFKKTELPSYNALLCYYAKIGLNYVEGTLDEQTKRAFMASGRWRNLSFEQKWVNEVNAILSSLWLDDQYKMTRLDQISCETLMGISNFQGVFSSIEDYIVQNKAYSILVDNGANKISEVLLRTEKALLDKERNLLKTVEERQAAYEHARQVLARFIREATNLIDKGFITNEKIEAYVSDVYTRILQNNDTVKKIAFEATKRLVTYIKKTGTKWDALCSKVGTKKSKQQNEDKLKSAIQGIIVNVFNEELKPPMELYVVNILSGKEQKFNEIYDTAVNRLQKELKRKWDIAAAEAPLLNSIPVPIVYGDIKTNVQKNFSEGLKVGKDTIGDTARAAIGQVSKDIVDGIVSLVVGVLVGMMYDFLLTGGIGSLFMLIYGALGSLIAWAVRRGGKTIDTPDDFNKDGKNIYNLISSNIYQCVNETETKEKMCFSEGGLSTPPKVIITATKENCKKQLIPIIELLEAEIRKREAEFAAAKEELKRESARIKKVREESIEPLRNGIVSFVNNITGHAES